jgi:hypothetical protein
MTEAGLAKVTAAKRGGEWDGEAASGQPETCLLN